MVYPTLAKNYGYTVQATDYFFVTPSFSFTYNIPNYNSTESAFFMGLDRFDYQITNSPLNTGFQWNVSITQGTFNTMTINTKFDDQMRMSQHWYLIISLIRCPIGYDIRGTNRTSGTQECFDSCY